MSRRFPLAAFLVGAALWAHAAPVSGQGDATSPQGAATTRAEAASRPTSRPAADVRVDPRVELMSVIFRLAGNPEYCRARLAPYARAADEHFGPYKDHAVVQLARRLRETRGVSFDAPMSLVAHIGDPPELKELVPLRPRPATLDSRWRDDELAEFLKQARLFVRDARFQKFLRAHRELHDLTEQRMRQALEKHARLEWFDRFFGRPGGRFRVCPALLNGPCCYAAAVRTSSGREMYCMLGVWNADAQGRPTFPPSVMPTVVHEFAHSYVNPVVDRHLEQLRGPAGRLLIRHRQALSSQGYGQWQTVAYESLVRASVVRYRAANDGVLGAMGESMQQAARGFPWVPELAGLLAEYEHRRDVYGDLDSFMPRVVEFLREYAARTPSSAPSSGATEVSGDH